MKAYLGISIQSKGRMKILCMILALLIVAFVLKYLIHPFR